MKKMSIFVKIINMENLHNLYNFVDKQFPTLIEGKIKKIKDNTISVEVPFRGDKTRIVTLNDAKVLNSKEISYVPKVGAKVLVASINKRYSDPIIIGEIGYSYKENEISIFEDTININKDNNKVKIKGSSISLNDNIVLDNTTKKIAIKNDTANIGEILKKILESLIKLGANLTSNAPFPIANTLIMDLTETFIKASFLFETESITLSNIDTSAVDEIKKNAKDNYEKMVEQHKKDNPLTDEEKAKQKATIQKLAN